MTWANLGAIGVKWKNVDGYDLRLEMTKLMTRLERLHETNIEVVITAAYWVQDCQGRRANLIKIPSVFQQGLDTLSGFLILACRHYGIM